jgi:GNAT superfamily N-acetyltransferase
MSTQEYTRVLPFQENDLAPLVEFWNNAFTDRRNFYPITVGEFRHRVLLCEAFDPHGLILAWHENRAGATQLVGLVHALRPPPPSGLYARWQQQHNLALLYVDPAYRRQGIGSRLLRAAENWLYYCPVYVGGPAQPCYGTVEGLHPPFFGASQQMGVSVHDTLLINFLAHRGYRVFDAGDVTLTLKLTPRVQPLVPDLTALGLRLLFVSHEQPFQGKEPPGREEYTLYGANGGAPYWGFLLVNGDNLLQAHISCYPMRQAGRVAIGGFWVVPSLRGHGLGRYLLDQLLYTLSQDDLSHLSAFFAGDNATSAGTFDANTFDVVEVQTHVIKHTRATALYERRGFTVEMAWVHLTKECAVRHINAVGMSVY